MTEQGKELQTTGMSDKAKSALQNMFSKALDKTGGFNMFPTLSMQHGVKKPKFEFEGMDEQAEVFCIIIQYETGREYREDRDEKRPTCSSVGGRYGTTFGRCSECDYGSWKEINGKNVKECKEHKKVLLVIEESDKVFEFKRPGTSLKNFSEYERHVASKERLALGIAKTKLTLDTATAPGRKPWSVLQLSFVEDIREGSPAFTEKVLKAIEEYDGFYKHTGPTASANADAKTDSPDASKEEKKEDDSDTFSLGDGVEVAEGEVKF